MKTSDLWNKFIAGTMNDKQMNFSYADFEKAIDERIKTELRWIPIEEALPPKEKDTDESEIVLILETQDFGNYFLGWYDYHQKAWFMVYKLHKVKPTHWRSVSF